jgi:hypothetical protein
MTIGWAEYGSISQQPMGSNMMTRTLQCPLCHGPIEDDEVAAWTHALALHPLPRTDTVEDNLKRSGDLGDHLLRVARGVEALSKEFEKYVIREPGDYVRHAALLARGRGHVVMNTPISPSNSAQSDLTYATRRKRKK